MEAAQKSRPSYFKACCGPASAVQPDHKIRPARSVKPKYLHRPVLSWKTHRGNTSITGKMPRKRGRPRIKASLWGNNLLSEGIARCPASISCFDHLPNLRFPPGHVPSWAWTETSRNHSATTRPLKALQVMYAPWHFFTTLYQVNGRKKRPNSSTYVI